MKKNFKFFSIILMFICLLVASSTIQANGLSSGASIISGYDGTGAPADAYGELSVKYEDSIGGSTYWVSPVSTVSSTVDSVFGDTLAALETSHTIAQSDTYLFEFTVTNKGNAVDSFVLNYSAVGTIAGLNVTFFANDGVTPITSSSDLAEEASENFYAAVYMPVVAMGISDTITITAVAQGGLGGDAGGYIGANLLAYAGNGDDTAVIVAISGSSDTPDMYVSVEVAVDQTNVTGYAGNVNDIIPGAELIYTITYDNDGADSAGNVVIYTYLPEGTDFDTAAAGDCLPDNNNSVGDITIEFSNDGITWNTDASAVANLDRIRWTLANQVSNDDNSEGTDTIGTVDGDSPDADSGKLVYKVYVK
jgi:uncharacterized repeat protein (TIGR01451 family)